MRVFKLLQSVAFVIVCHANAQPGAGIDSLRAYCRPMIQWGKMQSAPKTTNTASRIASYTYLIYENGIFLPTDSADYKYSGTHGGDLTGETWIKYDTATFYHYDNPNQLYQQTERYYQAFDASDNIATNTHQVWHSGTNSWRNMDMSTYSYTGNIITQQLSQNWSDVSGTWHNDRLYIDTLNANNDAIAELELNWDGGYWVPNSLYLNVYNVSHFITQQIAKEWDGNEMQSATNDIYVYDANNNVLTKTEKYWDPGSYTWVNSMLSTNTFDVNNNELTRSEKLWTCNTWVNSTLFINSNFTTAHMPQEQVHFFNFDGTYFEDSSQSNCSYNGNEQLAGEIDYQTYSGNWSHADGDFGARYHYDEYTATGIGGIANAGGEASVYPIPAVDALHIDIRWKDSQFFNISIVDLQGHVMKAWDVPESANYSTVLSTKGFAPGNYFIKISGQQQMMKQVVVTH